MDSKAGNTNTGVTTHRGIEVGLSAARHAACNPLDARHQRLLRTAEQRGRSSRCTGRRARGQWADCAAAVAVAAKAVCVAAVASVQQAGREGRRAGRRAVRGASSAHSRARRREALRLLHAEGGKVQGCV
eukprot:50422-Chlamydomonas_euryale.AAC.2